MPNAALLLECCSASQTWPESALAATARALNSASSAGTVDDDMGISDYLRDLRRKVGSDLLLMPAVTAMVFDEHDRVLLVKHSNRGIWVAPGGAIDPGEKPADAVVRETWEETGLHVEPVRITGVYGGHRVQYGNGDEVEYFMTVFECRRLSGTLRPDGEETLDVKFFDDFALVFENVGRRLP